MAPGLIAAGGRRLRHLATKARDEARYRLQGRIPRPVLFDHVPKCAGTTVWRYLRSQYPAHRVFEIDGAAPAESTQHFARLPRSTRMRYHLVGGHLAHRLREAVHPDALKLTILREPIARIVSHYHYVRTNPEHYLHDRVRDENISLDTYCELRLDAELSDWFVCHYSGLELDEARRHPAAAVDRALSEVMNVYDVIGFQDDLPDAMDRLAARAGFKRPFDNEVINASGSSLRARPLASSTQRRIAQANSLDVEFYRRLRESLAASRKKQPGPSPADQPPEDSPPGRPAPKPSPGPTGAA